MGKESVVHSWDREKGYTCTGNKTSTPKHASKRYVLPEWNSFLLLLMSMINLKSKSRLNNMSSAHLYLLQHIKPSHYWWTWIRIQIMFPQVPYIYICMYKMYKTFTSDRNLMRPWTGKSNMFVLHKYKCINTKIICSCLSPSKMHK